MFNTGNNLNADLEKLKGE